MTALWLAPDPLVLASGSASRRALLDGVGLPVQARPASIDERALEGPLVDRGAAPDAVAAALARAKAIDVAASHPGRVVLGGDQTLSLDGRSFHKPRSIAEARRQIAALAGVTHHLCSAIALVRDGTVLFETVCRAALTMRPLSEAMLDRYLALVGPQVCDSVGGYKIEGLGLHLFSRIEGDHSTILGLPLLPLLDALRRLGLVAE